jgi:hypothetical protein
MNLGYTYGTCHSITGPADRRTNLVQHERAQGCTSTYVRTSWSGRKKAISGTYQHVSFARSLSRRNSAGPHTHTCQLDRRARKAVRTRSVLMCALRLPGSSSQLVCRVDPRRSLARCVVLLRTRTSRARRDQRKEINRAIEPNKFSS